MSPNDYAKTNRFPPPPPPPPPESRSKARQHEKLNRHRSTCPSPTLSSDHHTHLWSSFCSRNRCVSNKLFIILENLDLSKWSSHKMGVMFWLLCVMHFSDAVHACGTVPAGHLQDTWARTCAELHAAPISFCTLNCHSTSHHKEVLVHRTQHEITQRTGQHSLLFVNTFSNSVLCCADRPERSLTTMCGDRKHLPTRLGK